MYCERTLKLYICIDFFLVLIFLTCQTLYEINSPLAGTKYTEIFHEIAIFH